MKKIYLACPYSHVDHEVRQQRFHEVNKAAAMLMRRGYLVFSPISHTHPIAEVGNLPKGWDFWESYDRSFIEWCDELYVLQLNGWQQSTGVNAEIAIAKQMCKPIVHCYIPEYGVLVEV